MKRLNTVTVMECFCSNDWELKLYAKKELLRRYGEVGFGQIAAAISEVNIEKMPFTFQNSTDITMLRITNFFCECAKRSAEKNNGYRISIQSIMELYHSEQEWLKQKSRDQIVHSYEKYVYSIIHSEFPQYDGKYMEELFQCGVIGLLNAMDGYRGQHAFTTYSKLFIIHEMYQFIYYLSEESSPYFAGIKSKIKKAQEVMRENNIVPTVEKISSLTGLSKKVVKRELEVIKRMDHVFLDDQDEKGPVNISDDRSNTEDQAEKNVRAEKVRISMMELSQDKRRILYLHVVENASYGDIAAELNMTIKEVKTYYQEAFSEMRSKKNIFYEE